MTLSHALPESAQLPAAESSLGDAARPSLVRFGLAAKIALWATALGSVVAVGMALFMYQSAVDALVSRETTNLSSSTNSVSVSLGERTEFARQDVLFLSRMAPVEAIVRAQSNGGVDPASGLDQGEWEARLARIFSVLLESRPSYSRLRYIGIADGGREIVRVERGIDGTIRRTPADALQQKGSQTFFQKAAALSPGDIYVSDFELNQEFGTVEVPHRPTVRTATPVFDDAGVLRGEVIVNIDAAYWFELLGKQVGVDQKLFVASHDGDYLVHPDPAMTFGFDLGQRHRMQEDMPHLAGLFDGDSPSYSGFVQIPDGEELAFVERVTFDPIRQRGYVFVGVMLDRAALFADIDARRNSIAMLAILLIAGSAGASLWLVRAVVGPLRDLTAAAASVAAGERDIDLSGAARRTDETGVLARAFAAMAEKIREREQAIAAKTEELSRSNQELSQFAYIASHDLQEPLRMVSSYLGLLTRRYRGKLDDEADEFIGYAVDGADRMKRLINDLLGYSRVSNRALSLEQVDANRVVAAVTEALAERIAETGAELTVDPLPRIEADPLQMERLFLNLIENAIKYRGDAAPRIHVAAERRDDIWDFSITDNGIGVPPEFQEKVFVIFTRLHGREKYPGTGIGLAACRRIVERHGGSISVEDAEGGGSVFRFTLPASVVEKEENDVG